MPKPKPLANALENEIFEVIRKNYDSHQAARALAKRIRQRLERSTSRWIVLEWVSELLKQNWLQHGETWSPVRTITGRETLIVERTSTAPRRRKA